MARKLIILLMEKDRHYAWQWPDWQPDPHLTIAHAEDPAELARICTEVEALMSAEIIEVEVCEVSLMTHEEGKWRRRQVFPLLEAPQPTGDVPRMSVGDKDGDEDVDG